MTMRFIGEPVDAECPIYTVTIDNGDSFAMGATAGTRPHDVLEEWARGNPDDPSACSVLSNGDSPARRTHLRFSANLGEALEAALRKGEVSLEDLRLSACPDVSIDGTATQDGWMLEMVSAAGMSASCPWSPGGRPSQQHYGELADLVRNSRDARGEDSPQRSIRTIMAEMASRVRGENLPRKTPSKGGR